MALREFGISSGAAIIAGNDKQIQFNDDGIFGVDPDLTWDKVTKKLKLVSVELEDRDGCLGTKEFHAHGSDGKAGYLKLKHGTTPTAHKEADHSILWSDDDKLYFEKEDGTDIDSRLTTNGELPGLEMKAIVASLTALVQKQQKQIDNLRMAS